MTSRDFCYWVQGALELGKKAFNEEETELLRRHLALVFIHEIDPSFPDEEQACLDAAHSGKAPSKEVIEKLKEQALADKNKLKPPPFRGPEKDQMIRC